MEAGNLTREMVLAAMEKLREPRKPGRYVMHPKDLKWLNSQNFDDATYMAWAQYLSRGERIYS